ncbi:MAG: intracellular septation protein A [Candidatus Pelagibacter sp. TMED197]|nr:intracellular septation protein A [Candidatus Pelagibacter sp.]OUW58027.1 MAG: intracellular septation protein A [Candidatus Pelagibacter sp. TMED197]
MNKSFLKFIADFGPLLIFFTIYYKSGNNLIVAIPPLIFATIVAVAVVYWVEKKIPYIPLVGGVVISLFGGLTLYFNNPVFLYMKPTIINIIFAITLIIGKIFFKKNLLKLFFKSAFQLNEEGWDKLNFRWAYFFIFLAILNEVVWRTQPETTWVNFKVWGIIPITFIFTALQLPMINKHKI